MNGVSTDALGSGGGGQKGTWKGGLFATGMVFGASGRRSGALGSGEIEWHVTMRLLRSKDLCFSLVVARLLLTKLLFLASLWLTAEGGVCVRTGLYLATPIVLFMDARDLLASHRGHLSHSDWGLVGRCWGVCLYPSGSCGIY